MDNIEIENDELMHYGVKGMKWGVRKSSNTSTSGHKKKKPGPVQMFVKKKNAAKKQKAAKKAAEEAAKKAKKRSISEMTNEELEARIKRLETEKRYRELVAASNPKATRGKEFVTRVLERSGEQLAVQVVNHYGAKALNKVIKEEAVFANNKKK